MRNIVRRVIGALFLLTGLAGMIFLACYLSRDLTIWIFGRHTPAYVTEKWVERTEASTDEELEFNYFLEYVYRTHAGKVLTATKSVSVREWGGALPRLRVEDADKPVWLGEKMLAQEEPVDVVYFPLYPAHNRIDDSRFVPLLLLSYVPLVGITLALLALGRFWLELDPHLLRRN